MANQVTKIADLINPEVLSGMLSGKIESKIRVTPFAKVDTTLVGQPGNTITVPAYEYIGDAEDIAEGVAVESVKLQTSTKQFSIKKAMKAVDITDESILSSYGDPVGQATMQLAKSIASKIDNDAMDALLGATTQVFDGSAAKISYSGIVDAIDLFGEEVNSEKVMFINPHQLTDLRKAQDFISADKYGVGMNVMISGEVGRICNTRVVVSNKVKLDEGSAFYTCPIVKLVNDAETEEDMPALTIYMKRSVGLETDRNVKAEINTLVANEHYGVALTNPANLVLAKFKK